MFYMQHDVNGDTDRDREIELVAMHAAVGDIQCHRMEFFCVVCVSMCMSMHVHIKSFRV